MSQSVNPRTRYATVAALAIAAGLAGAAHAGSDKDMNKEAESTAEARTMTASSPPLALDALVARLRAAGYSDFREVERENGRVEVKGNNAAGRRVELYVDAHTGEVLREARDD